MLMALATAGIVMCFLIPLAIVFGNVVLSVAQIVAVVAVSMLGIATFCAIGLFLGTVASGSAAPGVVNLVFFPMIYLSGMFFPLPKLLAPWALVWPTFYLDQLVIAVCGGKSFIDAKLCVGVLVGLTVLFTGLAVRRLVRQG
jgi:ABC-2 type transport system permease protein